MDKPGVTQLLLRLKDGEEGVYDQLYPLVYKELKGLAYAQMSHQSPDHTLSRTELVHEAYLKMIDQTRIDFNDKSHFFAIASRCMRQILIDYARKKNADKRGGSEKDVTYIDQLFHAQKEKSRELVGIDEALDKLSELNERLVKVVEMKFFGNMTIDQTASALGVSSSTVKRDWIKARGWLYRELKGRFEIK
ncbi:sigma-70 family RNA polymerase sigma factor [Aliifodinibius sp. S!AR15-10]|uniref:sigma-70 family RNA polymerase sigma factor n=1 Tax=Aliifodinibius sp. S!AR15-10 TaxID=2950437 RepID=UPI0028571E63|nr:sigma-70 family RNA polymerase sigma factor [Aliifodinibius sp. S!AR15-10]MDR8391772.1 sigma-70 family RNA polymerase sigma factor [Aliifodinibius sp. S!AR15-10]